MAVISYHRGGGETHHSATIAAYQAAREQKAEMVEADIWLSADKILFCAHDEFEPDGTRLADKTWAEIQQAHPEAPTFRWVLEQCNGVSICHIDLKGAGYELQTAELVLEVLDDPFENAWFTTLEDDSVRLIRDHHPNFEALLSIGRNMDGKPFLRMVWARLGEIVPFRRIRKSGATGVAVNHRLLTPFLKWYCTRSDRKIMVWTLNSDGQLKKFVKKSGVDVVITDRPLAAAGFRDASGN